MLIILHVSLALISLLMMAAATVGKWVQRSKDYDALVKVSGFCATGMVLTGVGLVFIYHTSITSACLSGLTSLLCLAAMYAAYRLLSARAS